MQYTMPKTTAEDGAKNSTSPSSINTHPTLHFTPAMYAEVLEQIAYDAEGLDWIWSNIRGELDLADLTYTYKLDTSLIIYRDEEGEMESFVPIYWKLTVFNQDEEPVPHDFTFHQLIEQSNNDRNNRIR